MGRRDWPESRGRVAAAEGLAGSDAPEAFRLVAAKSKAPIQKKNIGETVPHCARSESYVSGR